MKLSGHYAVHLRNNEAPRFSLPRIGRYIRLGLDIRKQRLQLAELSARQLEAMGITPQNASSEAKRAIWDLPPQQLTARLALHDRSKE